MNYHISHLLLRTNAALRLLESLDDPRQARLASVTAELALIERLLSSIARASDMPFEDTAIDVLEAVLNDGLDAIATASEEGAS